DPHVIAYVREHSGTHVVASIEPFGSPRPAGHKGGSLPDAALDQVLNALELHMTDDGSDDSCVGSRIAHKGFLGDAFGNRGRLLLPIERNEQAGRSIAGLPTIGKACPRSMGDCGFDIVVIEQDIGRLSAQLLMHAL